MNSGGRGVFVGSHQSNGRGRGSTTFSWNPVELWRYTPNWIPMSLILPQSAFFCPPCRLGVGACRNSRLEGCTCEVFSKGKTWSVPWKTDSEEVSCDLSWRVYLLVFHVAAVFNVLLLSRGDWLRAKIRSGGREIETSRETFPKSPPHHHEPARGAEPLTTKSDLLLFIFVLWRPVKS